MDTALPQKCPFILDRNLAKANCTGNQVCTSCDTVVLGLGASICKGLGGGIATRGAGGPAVGVWGTRGDCGPVALRASALRCPGLERKNSIRNRMEKRQPATTK